RFQALVEQSAAVVMGIGDDCARLALPDGHELLTSTDLLISGRHFYPDADPCDIGYKALAVNLSDLAAMGAKPLGFTLGLALGQVRDSWLDGFSNGLLQAAQQYTCPLIGGDTTRAASAEDCTVSITVFGQSTPPHLPLTRNAAKLGDEVWVSGCPGLARLGLFNLALQRDSLTPLMSATAQDTFLTFREQLPEPLVAKAQRALLRPTPRIDLGYHLLGLANSAIDLSDGLAGDLGHILKATGLGAVLDARAIAKLWERQGVGASSWPDFCLELTMTGGDDYELCFTASPDRQGEVLITASHLGLELTCIGRICDEVGLSVMSGRQRKPWVQSSFDHFQKGPAQ
ncbi:MAG: thiamine-phosphate kinase, partial [Limnobacter sp.]|nr:thiamine-phosphate kinase [Limnobacter sp.]